MENPNEIPFSRFSISPFHFPSPISLFLFSIRFFFSFLPFNPFNASNLRYPLPANNSDLPTWKLDMSRLLPLTGKLSGHPD